VEITLNALDDAIGMLSELEAAPGSRAASRRGRIDLAALLLEFAPTASLSIEPGAGTEVFGEEGDVRRMLHVLASQATFAGSTHDEAAVRILREGDFIRLTVNLGPDVSASAELERRWLSRMATRMGGSIELEGGTLSLLLPADTTTGEVEGLRKELEQAQQLGEAYARELANAFAAAEPRENESRTEPHDVAARRFELLLSVAAALHRPLAALVQGAEEQQISKDGAPSRRQATVHDLLADLHRLTACPRTETAIAVDLARTLRSVVAENEGHAARQGVRVQLEAPIALVTRIRPAALSLLLRGLLAQAIDATPRDGNVIVRLSESDGRPTVSVIDGGPVVPAAARAELLEHRVDPTALGRPPGMALLVAHVAAAYLGGRVVLGQSSSGAATAVARL
jgi:signal transduction histidine kinase